MPPWLNRMRDDSIAIELSPCKAVANDKDRDLDEVQLCKDRCTYIHTYILTNIRTYRNPKMAEKVTPFTTSLMETQTYRQRYIYTYKHTYKLEPQNGRKNDDELYDIPNGNPKARVMGASGGEKAPACCGMPQCRVVDSSSELTQGGYAQRTPADTASSVILTSPAWVNSLKSTRTLREAAPRSSSSGSA